MFTGEYSVEVLAQKTDRDGGYYWQVCQFYLASIVNTARESSYYNLAHKYIYSKYEAEDQFSPTNGPHYYTVSHFYRGYWLVFLFSSFLQNWFRKKL